MEGGKRPTIAKQIGDLKGELAQQGRLPPRGPRRRSAASRDGSESGGSRGGSRASSRDGSRASSRDGKRKGAASKRLDPLPGGGAGKGGRAAGKGGKGRPPRGPAARAEVADELAGHAQSRAQEKRAKLVKKAHDSVGGKRNRVAPKGKKTAQWRTQELLDDMAWLVDLNIAEGEPHDEATTAINGAADVMVEAEDLKSRLATSYNPGYVDKEFKKIVPKCFKAVHEAYTEMIKRSLVSLAATHDKYERLLKRNEDDGSPDDEATRLLLKCVDPIAAADEAKGAYDEDQKLEEPSKKLEITDDLIQTAHEAKMAVRAAGRAMMDRRREKIHEAEGVLADAQARLDAVVERNEAAGGPDDEATAAVVDAINKVNKAEALQAEMHEHATPEAADEFIYAVQDLDTTVTKAEELVSEREERVRNDYLQRLEKALKELEALDKKHNEGEGEADPEDEHEILITELLNAADEAAEAAEGSRDATTAEPANAVRFREFREDVEALEAAIKAATDAVRGKAADRLQDDEDRFEGLIQELAEIKRRDKVTGEPDDDARAPINDAKARVKETGTFHQELSAIDRVERGSEWDSKVMEFLDGVSATASAISAASKALDARDKRFVDEAWEITETITIIITWLFTRNRAEGEPNDAATTALNLARTGLDSAKDKGDHAKDAQASEEGLSTEVAWSFITQARQARKKAHEARDAFAARETARRKSLSDDITAARVQLDKFIERKTGHGHKVDAQMQDAIDKAKTMLLAAEEMRDKAMASGPPTEEWTWEMWIEWFELVDKLSSSFKPVRPAIKEAVLCAKKEVNECASSLHKQRERYNRIRKRMRDKSDGSAEGDACWAVFESSTTSLKAGEELEHKVMAAMAGGGDGDEDAEERFVSCISEIVTTIDEWERLLAIWDKASVAAARARSQKASARLASVSARVNRGGPERTDEASAAVNAAVKKVPGIESKWDTIVWEEEWWEIWDVTEVWDSVTRYEAAVDAADAAARARQAADVEAADKRLTALRENMEALAIETEAKTKTIIEDARVKFKNDPMAAGKISDAATAAEAETKKTIASVLAMADKASKVDKARTDDEADPGCFAYDYIQLVDSACSAGKEAFDSAHGATDSAEVAELTAEAEASMVRLLAVKATNEHAGEPPDEATGKVKAAFAALPPVVSADGSRSPKKKRQTYSGAELAALKETCALFDAAVTEAETAVRDRQAADVAAAEKKASAADAALRELAAAASGLGDEAAAALRAAEEAVSTAARAPRDGGLGDCGKQAYAFVALAEAAEKAVAAAGAAIKSAGAAKGRDEGKRKAEAARARLEKLQARNAAAGDPDDMGTAKLRAAEKAFPAAELAGGDVAALTAAAGHYDTLVSEAEAAILARQEAALKDARARLAKVKDEVDQLKSENLSVGNPDDLASKKIAIAVSELATAVDLGARTSEDDSAAPGRAAYAFIAKVADAEKASAAAREELNLRDTGVADAVARGKKQLAEAKAKLTELQHANEATGTPVDDASHLLDEAESALTVTDTLNDVVHLEPVLSGPYEKLLAAIPEAIAKVDAAAAAMAARGKALLSETRKQLMDVVERDAAHGKPNDGAAELLKIARAKVEACDSIADADAWHTSAQQQIMEAQQAVEAAAKAVAVREEGMIIDGAKIIAAARQQLEALQERNKRSNGPNDAASEQLALALELLNQAAGSESEIEAHLGQPYLEDIKQFLAILPKLEQATKGAAGAMATRGAFKMFAVEKDKEHKASEARHVGEARLEGLRGHLKDLEAQLAEMDVTEDGYEDAKAAVEKLRAKIEAAEAAIKYAAAHPRNVEAAAAVGPAVDGAGECLEEAKRAMAKAEKLARAAEDADEDLAAVMAQVADANARLSAARAQLDLLAGRNAADGSPPDEATDAIMEATRAVVAAESFEEQMSHDRRSRRKINGALFIPKVDFAEEAVAKAQKAMRDRGVDGALHVQLAAAASLATLALRIAVERLERLLAAPELSAVSPQALQAGWDAASEANRLRVAADATPTRAATERYVRHVMGFTSFVSAASITKQHAAAARARGSRRRSVQMATSPGQIGQAVLQVNKARAELDAIEECNDKDGNPLDLASTRVTHASSALVAAETLQLLDFVAEHDTQMAHMFIKFTAGLEGVLSGARDAIAMRNAHMAKTGVLVNMSGSSSPSKRNSVAGAEAATSPGQHNLPGYLPGVSDASHDKRFLAAYGLVQGMQKLLVELRGKHDARAGEFAACPEVDAALMEAEDLMSSASTVCQEVLNSAGEEAQKAAAETSGGAGGPGQRRRSRRRSIFEAKGGTMPLWQVAPHIVDEVEGYVLALQAVLARTQQLVNNVSGEHADVQEALAGHADAIRAAIAKTEAGLAEASADMAAVGDAGGAVPEALTKRAEELKSGCDEGVAAARAECDAKLPAGKGAGLTLLDMLAVIELAAAADSKLRQLRAVVSAMRRAAGSATGIEKRGGRDPPAAGELEAAKVEVEAAARAMEQFQMRLASMEVAHWMTADSHDVAVGRITMDATFRNVLAAREGLACGGGMIVANSLGLTTRGGNERRVCSQRHLPDCVDLEHVDDHGTARVGRNMIVLSGADAVEAERTRAADHRRRAGGRVGESMAASDFAELSTDLPRAAMLVALVAVLCQAAEVRGFRAAGGKGRNICYTKTRREANANARLALLRKKLEMHAAAVKQRAAISNKFELQVLRLQEALSQAGHMVDGADYAHRRLSGGSKGRVLEGAVLFAALTAFSIAVAEATVAVDELGMMLDRDGMLVEIYGNGSVASRRVARMMRHQNDAIWARGFGGGAGWGWGAQDQSALSDMDLAYMASHKNSDHNLPLYTRALVDANSQWMTFGQWGRRVRYIDIVARLRKAGAFYNHLVAHAREAMLVRVPVAVGVPLKSRIVGATQKMTTADRALPPPKERARMVPTKPVLYNFWDLTQHATFGVYQFERAMEVVIRDLARLRELDRQREQLLEREERSLMDKEDARKADLAAIEREAMRTQVRAMEAQLSAFDAERERLHAQLEAARKARAAQRAAGGDETARAIEVEHLQEKVLALEEERRETERDLRAAEKALATASAGAVEEERVAVDRLAQQLNGVVRERESLARKLEEAEAEAKRAKMTAVAEITAKDSDKDREIEEMRANWENVNKEREALKRRLAEVERAAAEARETEARRIRELEQARAEAEARAAAAVKLQAVKRGRDARTEVNEMRSRAASVAASEISTYEQSEDSATLHLNGEAPQSLEGSVTAARDDLAASLRAESTSDAGAALGIAAEKEGPTGGSGTDDTESVDANARLRANATSPAPKGSPPPAPPHRSSGSRGPAVPSDTAASSHPAASPPSAAPDAAPAAEPTPELAPAPDAKPPRDKEAGRDAGKAAVAIPELDMGRAKSREGKSGSRRGSSSREGKLSARGSARLVAVGPVVTDRQSSGQQSAAAANPIVLPKDKNSRSAHAELEIASSALTDAEYEAKSEALARAEMAMFAKRQEEAQAKDEAATHIQKVVRGKAARNEAAARREANIIFKSSAMPMSGRSPGAVGGGASGSRGDRGTTGTTTSTLSPAYKSNGDSASVDGDSTGVGTDLADLYAPLHVRVGARGSRDRVDVYEVFELHRREAAAVRIQAVGRGRLSRYRCEMLRDELWRPDRDARARSATAMQRIVKRRRALNSINNLRELLIANREEISRRVREHDALLKLQALARGIHARAVVTLLRDEVWRPDREERLAAAKFFQRMYRRRRALTNIRTLKRRLLRLTKDERVMMLGLDVKTNQFKERLHKLAETTDKKIRRRSIAEEVPVGEYMERRRSRVSDINTAAAAAATADKLRLEADSPDGR